MKCTAKLLSVLFFSYAIISCAPLYVPTTHNTPMFSGKNEFQASVSGLPGLNIQTAYSVSNHFGLTTNYLYARTHEKENGRTHHAGEIGLGYYINTEENSCFEIFAGVGVGKGQAFDSSFSLIPPFYDDPYKAKGKYYKIFLQPSIGMNKGSIIWNFSVRLSYVDFTKMEVFRRAEPIPTDDQPKIFIEPLIQLQIPMLKGKIYGSFQAGVNLHLGAEPSFDYEPIIGSFGLILKIKPPQ